MHTQCKIFVKFAHPPKWNIIDLSGFAIVNRSRFPLAFVYFSALLVLWPRDLWRNFSQDTYLGREPVEVGSSGGTIDTCPMFWLLQNQNILYYDLLLKVAFFRNCNVFFKSPKKKYSKKPILNMKFKFPTNNSILYLVGNLDFKLRLVFLEYFYFGDLGVWKMTRTFWKKKHL